MPREYAKNWFSMWTDEDFTNQPRFDKLLYQVLLGQPPTMLNYAGVQTLSFKRWRKAMRDGEQLPTELEIKAALVRMERRRNVYTDDDTAECLIRSFIRRDEVHKQPNVLLSALRAAAVVESPKLCAVLLDELKNRVELPEIKVKGSKNEAAAQRLRDTLDHTYAAALSHLERRSQGLPEVLPEPFGEDFPEPLPEGFSRPAEIEPLPEPLPEGIGEPPVVVEVEVSSLRNVATHLGGARARETTEPDDNPEPEQFCALHRPNGAPDIDCGPCGSYRKLHNRWKANQTKTVDHDAEARRAARENCTRCQGTCTYEDDAGRVHKCDHTQATAHA